LKKLEDEVGEAERMLKALIKALEKKGPGGQGV
jgi:hypothetical protein